MPTASLFVTRFYEDRIDQAELIEQLERSCRALASDDLAGRKGCRDNGYAGYTSYASLNDLPKRDPTFAELVPRLDRHVASFASECAFDLDKRLRLDSFWVNVLKPGGTHPGHIHPHSVVSGTFYVLVPKGAGGLKLEDPRLPMMMAAPSRRGDAPEELRTFVYRDPEPGSIFLWESWLRHEVIPGNARGQRISISFNYR